MQVFFANHFLQSLAFALLNSLWQMAFLWIILILFSKIINVKANIQFLIQLSIKCAGFFWFIYTFFNAYSLININLFNSSILFSNTILIEKIFPVLSIIYLFFVLVLIINLGLRYYELKELKKNQLKEISNNWQVFVSKAVEGLQISKNVKIYISKNIVSPLTIGFFKPIILIPISAINNLSPAQMETILLHELLHIKRNDYLINLFVMFIDVIMFFNPFSKLISDLINTQRELCCDDEVLSNSYSTSLYAEALLNVAKSQKNFKPLFASINAISESEKHLKHRINRILRLQIEKTNHINFNKNIFFSFLFGTILFVLIGFINFKVNAIVNEKILVSVDAKISKTASFNNIIKSNNEFKKQNKIVKSNYHSFKKSKKQYSKFKNNTLLAERESITKGFQFISKLAKENGLEDATLTYFSDDFVEYKNSNTEFSLIPLVKTNAATNVQQFFIPATSKSTASIIIVTTIEKDDGNKVVKIEIERGKGKVD